MADDLSNNVENPAGVLAWLMVFDEILTQQQITAGRSLTDPGAMAIHPQHRHLVKLRGMVSGSVGVEKPVV